jgi:DNA-binding winged helix-turn-helix (wHTH) protein
MRAGRIWFLGVGKNNVIYLFHGYTLNSATRTLCCGGETVKLQPKVMDLLLVLIENRRRFVSKPELYERLWGTLHVGSASLVRLVREIRRAFGDDGANQHFIRTLHSRGYQFIAPVRCINVSDESVLGVNGGDEDDGSQRARRALMQVQQSSSALRGKADSARRFPH